jgi:hypothetical protein
VTGAGPYAVGKIGGEFFAVSRRCRHLGADLAGATVDEQGRLVCPWHQSGVPQLVGIYLCQRLDGVRRLRAFHPDWPLFQQLYRYGRNAGLKSTRSRSGNKNDGAHVEQENWTTVRRPPAHGLPALRQRRRTGTAQVRSRTML